MKIKFKKLLKKKNSILNGKKLIIYGQNEEFQKGFFIVIFI